MCMKNYDAEKIIFDKFTAIFNIAIFLIIAYKLIVGSACFVKSTPPRAFILCRHVPHILKMCMKNYNDEKIFFDKFTAFFNIVIFDHCLYTIMVGSA